MQLSRLMIPCQRTCLKKSAEISMINSSQSLDDLKREVENTRSTMTEIIQEKYPSDRWSSMENKINSLSETIQRSINEDTLQYFNQTEMNSARNIEEKFRQMLVMIKAKKKLVSEELRKIKQREVVNSVYQEA